MGEILRFWPKNDVENWSRNNIFKIPPCEAIFYKMNLPQRGEEF